jgi:hypothetical protein
MESQKSFLWDLSADGLAWLTVFLNADDIGRLLISGDPRLMEQLHKPGAVSTVYYKGHQNLQTILKTFIHHALTHLEVAIDSYSFDKHTLDLLPSTLLCLEIQYLEPSFALPDLSLFDVSLYLPNLEYLALPILFGARYANWTLTLPKSTKTLIVPEISDWCPLPTHLEGFRCTGDLHCLLISEFAPLPPALTALEFTSPILGVSLKKVFSCLPPSLRALKLNYDGELSSKDTILLPNALQCLVLAQTTLIFENMQKTSPFILPSGLLELSIQTDDPPELSRGLPGTLVTLNIQFVSGEFDVDSFAASLPDGLKTLIMKSSEDFYGEFRGPAVLPPRLTSLEMHFKSSDMICEEDTIQSIPPTITNLNLSHISDNVTHFPKLPNLRIFEAVQAPIVESMLKSLAIGSPMLRFFLVGRTNSTPQPLINRSPPTNEAEEIRPAAYAGAQFESHLEIFELAEAAGPEFLQFAPSTISVLHWNDSPYSDVEAFQSLNRFKTLEELFMGCSSFSGETFELLPRSLKSLEVENAGIIENRHIHNLPRSLTLISLSNANNLTNECAPFLPPTCKDFYVRNNKKLSHNFLKHLPESIRSNLQSFSLETASFAVKNGKFV